MMATLPPISIPRLLRQHNLRPKRSLGQNFLADESALLRIVSCAELSANDAVLEIGPGLGSLTRYLALQARWVVAVELDSRLFPILQEVLSAFSNVRLVQGDILDLDPASLMDAPDYLVVANIPYYITSALIRHLIESTRPPRRMILTVQEEVARRICARAGEMNLLALSVQLYGEPQIVARIPAGAFYPPPKVDSAVVRIDLLPAPRLPPPWVDLLFKLARAAFSQKRKTLRNALSAGMGWSHQQVESILSSAGIPPERRAETLDLEDWKRIVRVVASGEAHSSPPQDEQHPGQETHTGIQ